MCFCGHGRSSVSTHHHTLPHTHTTHHLSFFTAKYCVGTLFSTTRPSGGNATKTAPSCAT
ncbi:hypothetical protein CCHR01_14666 [Colletotrichum chrysophilum]|uniref:Uncharacterized protein n=1 Tax=Colletotrichum chrysophilum TaxID=1836956 RepID=A0AAD9EC28_9PEZI|nr:hypothetical protein CCHR01_14666 [Colletotrichum chrysophilum]